jgi:hypothetical protein
MDQPRPSITGKALVAGSHHLYSSLFCAKDKAGKKTSNQQKVVLCHLIYSLFIGLNSNAFTGNLFHLKEGLDCPLAGIVNKTNTA